MTGGGSLALRPIDASRFAGLPERPEIGVAPMLQWIKIADLVVNDLYQRPISGAGVTNVRRIAVGFRWSKFAPVVVSPVEGGQFAIIDGQHRTTAAALLGIEAVPALVVIADARAQAEAFKSINGNVTKVSPLSLHHAAVMAADPEAVEIQRAADAAGVSICRYPKPVGNLAPGETLALNTIRIGLRDLGFDAVVSGLQCVTETENNRPGGLSAIVLQAIFALLAENKKWRDAGEALLAAFDNIDLATEVEETQVTRRPKGVPLWTALTDRLRARLLEALG